MPIITPPQRLSIAPSDRLVFLAGSIEMGRAEPWQEAMGQALMQGGTDLIVANPRRADWDASWEQSIGNPHFREQVDWELDHLDRADLVVFYFQPDTQSPITLLELGRHLARPDVRDATLVCCPEGFWRRGNVEIMMNRAGLGRPLESLGALNQAALAKVHSWGRAHPSL